MTYNIEHYHGDFVPIKKERIQLENFEYDDIFIDRVWTAFPDVNNDEILRECYDSVNHLPGTNRSNMGGWQSEVRPLDSSVFRGALRNIYDLGNIAVEFSNECMKTINSTCEFDISGAHLWVNMNHDYAYNVIHSHPGADLIVLYYPLYEGEEQGELRIVRTDGCVHVNTYNGTDLAMEHCPRIQEGAFIAFPPHLLHYVTPNLSGRDRVSISFNMSQ